MPPQDISKPVFKMATLNDFGIYITPKDSTLMDHILEPLTVSARIQNNLTANEDAEKGSAQLEVPKLN